MKVRIIGAGAVGAVVGWKLYKHADLAFIVDEEGKIVYSHSGYTPGSEQELLDKLLEIAGN